MPHKKPIIGYAWVKAVPDKDIEFVNLSVNKKELMDIIEDQYGNVNLTAAPIRHPKEKSKATHVVYEDDLIIRKKR